MHFLNANFGKKTDICKIYAEKPREWEFRKTKGMKSGFAFPERCTLQSALRLFRTASPFRIELIFRLKEQKEQKA